MKLDSLSQQVLETILQMRTIGITVDDIRVVKLPDRWLLKASALINGKKHGLWKVQSYRMYCGSQKQAEHVLGVYKNVNSDDIEAEIISRMPSVVKHKLDIPDVPMKPCSRCGRMMPYYVKTKMCDVCRFRDKRQKMFGGSKNE